MNPEKIFFVKSKTNKPSFGRCPAVRSGKFCAQVSLSFGTKKNNKKYYIELDKNLLYAFTTKSFKIESSAGGNYPRENHKIVVDRSEMHPKPGALHLRRDK